MRWLPPGNPAGPSAASQSPFQPALNVAALRPAAEWFNSGLKRPRIMGKQLISAFFEPCESLQVAAALMSLSRTRDKARKRAVTDIRTGLHVRHL